MQSFIRIRSKLLEQYGIPNLATFEVHCSENTISVWSAEWGYKTLVLVALPALEGEFQPPTPTDILGSKWKIYHLRHHSR